MSDEFDGCECVWSHELAMRRLLTLIRRGQSYCTDSECLDITELRRTSNNEPADNFTMLTLFLIFAAILYLIRPNSILRTMDDSKKHDQHPPSSDDSQNGSPPAVN